jgi:branched-chain amino acid transport system permease protein
MGFAIIFEGLMRGLTSFTGGSSGLAVGSFSAFGYTFTSLTSQFYLAIVIFGLVYAWSRAVVRRQPGRVMKAVHSDELAARSLGVDTSRVKVKVFVLSALIASVMGSLYAHFESFASPDQFGIVVSLLLLTMLIIGGEGTLWGAVIGVAVLRVIPEFFSSFSEYQLLIEGVLLTGVLLLFPAGAAGGRPRWANSAGRPAPPPPPPTAPPGSSGPDRGTHRRPAEAAIK